MSSPPALCAHSSLQHLTVGKNRGQSDPSVLGLYVGNWKPLQTQYCVSNWGGSAKCLGCVLNLRSIPALSPTALGSATECKAQDPALNDAGRC